MMTKIQLRCFGEIKVIQVFLKELQNQVFIIDKTSLEYEIKDIKKDMENIVKAQNKYICTLEFFVKNSYSFLNYVRHISYTYLSLIFTIKEENISKNIFNKYLIKKGDFKVTNKPNLLSWRLFNDEYNKKRVGNHEYIIEEDLENFIFERYGAMMTNIYRYDLMYEIKKDLEVNIKLREVLVDDIFNSINNICDK